jgi:hypothetical protein
VPRPHVATVAPPPPARIRRRGERGLPRAGEAGSVGSPVRGSAAGTRIARAPEPKSPARPTTACALVGTLYPGTTNPEIRTSEVASMTTHRGTRPAGRRLIPIALAAAGLATVVGCGGEERLSRDAFNDQLQSIDQQGSARYERLAQQATRLNPDQPLTDEIKHAMRQYARALARAADQLDQLNPPSGAEAETATLTEALRQRAETFEQAAREQRVTLRQLEHQRPTTNAGEKIDRAFEQLRAQGFLRQEPPRDPRDR